MARVLNHFSIHNGYSLADIRIPSLLQQKEVKRKWDDAPVVTASSVWLTFQALQEVNRPEERSGWLNFDSSGRVAWKTGTSFGFRDAWAVAITPRHVIAVWAGNANGEGRAGLTGSLVAAPVLFDLLDLIPNNDWFVKPFSELTTVETCRESGYRISPLCPHKTTIEIPFAGLKTPTCPYHHRVHLSEDRCWQVNSSCYPVARMVHDSCFVLPPGMEWYYRKFHPEYKVLPPLMAGCQPSGNYPMIELLYPQNLHKLYVPIEMNGERGRIVFEAAHRDMGTRLFWHLDNRFIAETLSIHQLALSPGPGEHVLCLVDETGNSLTRKFFIQSAVKK
jgi:penicillin-binding protein 1C